MFSVIFEVHPKSDQWDAYLGYGKLLRPELERVEGFVDNIRYRSLMREGWILSLSGWRDEKALVRWRIKAVHHDVQEKGRFKVFLDYHLRVGQVTADSHLPDGHALREQRLDVTEVGDATTIVMIDAKRPAGCDESTDPTALATSLGFTPGAPGLVGWDVFDAVLTPGDLLLLLSFRDQAAAEAFEGATRPPDGARRRRVRVVRDYGMYDRRETPQFYPEVDRPASIEASYAAARCPVG